MKFEEGNDADAAQVKPSFQYYDVDKRHRTLKRTRFPNRPVEDRPRPRRTTHSDRGYAVPAVVRYDPQHDREPGHTVGNGAGGGTKGKQ